MLAAGHDPDHLVACFNDFGAGFMTVPSCLRKTPAGWGVPERLGMLPPQLGSGPLSGRIAMSGDGQQLTAESDAGQAAVAYRFSLAP